MNIGKVVEAFESAKDPVMLHFPLDKSINKQNEIAPMGRYLTDDGEEFPGYGLQGPVVDAYLKVLDLQETIKKGKLGLEAYGHLITFHTREPIPIKDPNGDLYSKNTKWFQLPENRIKALYEELIKQQF